MTLAKNQIIPLTITALSHEGDGIGRHAGMAVFVPLTAIGDVLTVKIVKVLKNYAYGIIDTIVEPSRSRVENACPVYKRCGGCSLRHIDYAHELKIKHDWVAENLKRIGGVEIALEPILPSPQAERYRNKAQYPVRMVNGKIQAGFFAKRSHELIPVQNCLLQPAFFSRIVEQVLLFMRANNIPPYDEKTGTGVVRHIFLRYAEATGEAMLCLVINDKLPQEARLVRQIQAACPQISTIVLNENRANTNVIFGEKTRVIAGSGYISDVLGGVRVNISAQSFYQVNQPAAEQLYAVALEYAQPKPGDVLLDLYCGTGTIGLSMASQAGQIVGVEVVEAAIMDAKQNAAQNGISNAKFFCADADAAAKILAREQLSPDILVLDPPRKGCAQEVLEFAAACAPQKIVYISCNSATLARDIKILTGMGYAVAKARAADLFPRTSHVESLVLLTRSDLSDSR